MKTGSLNGSRATDFLPLVEVDMDIGVFGASWGHCDRISTYIARMVSHNRRDSLLYSNLFSSALNELLETVFRTHGGDGTFVCAVRRSGPVDRIELTVPCNDNQAGFYWAAMEALNGANVAERYRAALFSTGSLDPSIGLLELAVDYAAKMSVERIGSDAIRLTAELEFEDENH